MNVFTAVLALGSTVLNLVLATPALSNGQTMRVYNTRMETLFMRLDLNRDGRLDARELAGRRALTRRLKRQKNRSYLLIDDLRSPGDAPSGQRLQKHFRRADQDGDRRLDRQEAKRIPWISRHFKTLDLNGDGGVTLSELWSRQQSLAPPQRRP